MLNPIELTTSLFIEYAYDLAVRALICSSILLAVTYGTRGTTKAMADTASMWREILLKINDSI